MGGGDGAFMEDLFAKAHSLAGFLARCKIQRLVGQIPG
jgi:hypothetical protein